MINVQIDIQDAVANQLLRDITRGLTHREELNQNVAIGVKELVRGNLIRNYTGRTRHGNFWQRVVNSIETQSSATEASVSLVELGIGCDTMAERLGRARTRLQRARIKGS